MSEQKLQELEETLEKLKKPSKPIDPRIQKEVNEIMEKAEEKVKHLSKEEIVHDLLEQKKNLDKALEKLKNK